MGLVLENFSSDPAMSAFEFSYYDDQGSRLAYYRFKSWQDNEVNKFRNWQDLDSDILVGPASVSSVPVRESDAVLMTVNSVPSTWAVNTYKVRLILRGVIQWDWETTFEVGTFPFRLDGTWTQMG